MFNFWYIGHSKNVDSGLYDVITLFMYYCSVVYVKSFMALACLLQIFTVKRPAQLQ